MSEEPGSGRRVRGNGMMPGHASCESAPGRSSIAHGTGWALRLKAERRSSSPESPMGRLAADGHFPHTDPPNDPQGLQASTRCRLDLFSQAEWTWLSPARRGVILPLQKTRVLRLWLEVFPESVSPTRTVDRIGFSHFRSTCGSSTAPSFVIRRRQVPRNSLDNPESCHGTMAWSD